jgi:hypothetical protein
MKIFHHRAPIDNQIYPPFYKAEATGWGRSSWVKQSGHKADHSTSNSGKVCTRGAVSPLHQHFRLKGELHVTHLYNECNPVQSTPDTASPSQTSSVCEQIPSYNAFRFNAVFDKCRHKLRRANSDAVSGFECILFDLSVSAPHAAISANPVDWTWSYKSRHKHRLRNKSLSFSSAIFCWKLPVLVSVCGWVCKYRVIEEEIGDSIGHCEKKKVYMHTCQIPNGYQDRAVWNCRSNSVRFSFVGLDEEGTLQKKCGCTRRIARSNSEFCFPHERIVKINSDEKHAIFAHEWQSALRLKVGFSKIYVDP